MTEFFDPMLFEWRSSYYPRDIYTEESRIAERKRRVDLGQFVMQRDSPGGVKQFRAFANFETAYNFIISTQIEDRTFYETIFDVHPYQKPHFDIDIVPSEEDPMDHEELLNRLLTELKRVIGAELDLVDDIGVFSSHAQDGSKKSYHVVLTGFYVKDNIEAGNFAKSIRDGMIAMTSGIDSPEAIFITKCVDLLVYKKLQQFRLLGCTKIGRNRHKIIVTEYSAAGRTRRRPPVTEPLKEFKNSLLTIIDEINCRYLEPNIYSTTDTTADSILRALCSRNHGSGSGEMSEDIWFKDSMTIISHLIEASHLTSDLSSNCRRSQSKGTLITLRKPSTGGYWCILCERKHYNENPYITLYEDHKSTAVTEYCPRVVAIIYRCRRDPLSSVRLCSMRGGGSTGMSSFTCIEEPHDTRQGEKFVRAPSGSCAVDC